MAQELIYTSFPKGVKPGVSGFCTVAVSPDLAPNMISRLEGLSGYRHLYMPGTPEADLNPPNWSHVVISVGNAESHVVYRVADAGLDYTGRSNKLGHFIVLDKNDLAPCGPAAMLTTPGLIDVAFDQQVGTRPFSRPIPRQLVSPRPCLAWRQAAGDAGWAGELAQTAWTGKYACIVYKPGMNVLALIQEAMALLPPERRWKTTFSTYYSKLPTGIDCQWRCVAAGTPEASQAIAEVGSGLVIDLSNGALAPAPESPAAASARAGRMVLAPAGQKSDNAASRRRPVQTAKSAAADAAVNAGIQEELQTIDASNTSNAEDELFSKMDSLQWSASSSRTMKKPQAASRTSYGLFAAMIAGVILLGVGAAAFYVMSNKSSETVPVASNDDSGSNSQSEQSNDALNPNSEDAIGNDEQQTVDEQMRLELEELARLEKEEQALEEQAKKEAEERQKEEEELQRIEAQEKARQEQEEKEAAERARLAEIAKAKKEAEDKIFNDPRWAGADREQFIIYVDSNDVPDYTRLNMQLQNLKSPVVKLNMTQLYKDNSGLSDYELTNDADSSCYVVKINSIDSDIKIHLNDNKEDNGEDNFEPLPITKNNKQSLVIEGDGELAFRDFSSQCALMAAFADDTSKVISFFKQEPDKELKKTLLQALNEKYRNGFVYTYTEGNLVTGYFVSKIKMGCSENVITIQNKSYNIVSCRVNNKTGDFEILIEVNFPLKAKEEQKDKAPSALSQDNAAENQTELERDPEPEIIKYVGVCFVKDKKTVKSYRVKYKLEIAYDDGSIHVFEGSRANAYFNNPIFSRQLKQIAVSLPLYLDVYLESDPFAANATREPFLWKRIVLPSADEFLK